MREDKDIPVTSLQRFANTQEDAVSYFHANKVPVVPYWYSTSMVSAYSLLFSPSLPHMYHCCAIKPLAGCDFAKLSSMPIMWPHSNSVNFLYGTLHCERSILTRSWTFIVNGRRYPHFKAWIQSFIHTCQAEALKALLSQYICNRFVILIICAHYPALQFPPSKFWTIRAFLLWYSKLLKQ